MYRPDDCLRIADLGSYVPDMIFNPIDENSHIFEVMELREQL